MRKALGLVLLALAACGPGTPPPVDRRDPAAVARAFVEAYNERNLQRMLPLVDQVNLDAIGEALEDGPGSQAYEAIFAPDVVEVLARENGKVEGPRFDRRDAVVKVGESEAGDVFTVVLAETASGEWTIVANAVMSRQDFASLAGEPRR